MLFDDAIQNLISVPDLPKYRPSIAVTATTLKSSVCESVALIRKSSGTGLQVFTNRAGQEETDNASYGKY